MDVTQLVTTHISDMCQVTLSRKKRLLCCGLRCHLVWQKAVDVSEEPAASNSSQDYTALHSRTL